MFKFQIYTCFLFILCLFFCSSVSAGKHSFHHIGMEDGLSQPSVMQISQDGLGRMWFGTKEGVNIYDGIRMTTFKGYVTTTNNNRMWFGNSIDCLKADKKGNMYIICDFNLFFFDLETNSIKQITTDNNTTAIEIVNDSVIYAKKDSIYWLNADQGHSTGLMKHDKGMVNILLADGKQVYMGTDKGLYVVDWYHSFTCTPILEQEDVYSLLKTSSKGLWIATRMNGLYIYHNGDTHKVPLGSKGNGVIDKQVRQMVEDDNRTIWIGTFSGLQSFDCNTEKFTKIDIPRYAGGLNHLSIFSLFKDNQGTVWVGSYYGGVNYFNPKIKSYFNYVYQTSTNADSYFSYIRSMVQDKYGRLWIGTDGGGVSCVNRQWQTIKHFSVNSKNPISHNNIKALCYDEVHDKIYVGMHLGGLNSIDVKTGSVKKYQMGNHLYPSDVIFDLRKWGNYLVISSRKGVFTLDISTDEFKKLPLPSGYYVHFDVDENGMFYGIVYQHLIIYSLQNPKIFEKINLNPYGLNTAVSHLKINKGNVYLTTLGGGLLCWSTREHKLVSQTTENSNIFSDYCYGLDFIHPGKAILTSDQGIMLYDETTGLFTNLELKDRRFRFINGCGLYVSDNEIYAGTTQGITCLQEADFYKEDIQETSLYFSSILINNKLLSVNDETGILQRSLPFTNRIDLKHNQNHIIIQLASSDYLNSQIDAEYEYQLSGESEEWIRMRTPQIQYTNLSPGTYTLRIKEAGETAAKKSLIIHIAAPWYGTRIAWSIYLLVLGLGTFLFIRNRRIKLALKISLEREIYEKKKNDETNHAKLVFFTNISHEFRTPITLISSYIDQLTQDTKDYSSIHKTVLKLRKNTLKLNSLVTELLDFRKFSQDEFMLHLSENDFYKFILNIYSSFEDYAGAKQISYQFTANKDDIIGWFDAVQLEKVFYNILSNAFKYTHHHGNIQVEVKQLDQEIVVSVSDSGIGIGKEDFTRIFDRFYQSDNALTITGSTGIGLSLSKEIIEKHHGRIEVFSEKGKGSTFIITIPYHRNVYEQDPHIAFMAENENDFPVIVDEVKNINVKSDLETDQECCSILLVEDNEELLQVLKELFEKHFKVLTATNGKEALESVRSKMPDLVVSDVMMPIMSGTELCVAIKNNIDYCHIPVILLTALDGVQQNMEGFNRGADAYISKPFHADLLLARVKNLIRNRKLIHYQFYKKPIEEIDLTCVREMDQELLQKTGRIIEAHMDDISFDIPQLCQELGISRSLLYTKFKSLTGMTPNNFIMNTRLKHAATLLLQDKTLSISEVCDRCGFNAPAYFSKCFKLQYNITPLDYRKKHESTNK